MVLYKLEKETIENIYLVYGEFGMFSQKIKLKATIIKSRIYFKN